MKLAVIFAIASLAVCSAQQSTTVNHIFSEHVVVPANASEVVEYRIKFPSEVSLSQWMRKKILNRHIFNILILHFVQKYSRNVKRIVDVDQHSSTLYPATIHRQQEIGNTVITLESEPGQGIDTYITVVFEVHQEDNKQKFDMRKSLMVPAASGNELATAQYNSGWARTVVR